MFYRSQENIFTICFLLKLFFLAPLRLNLWVSGLFWLQLFLNKIFAFPTQIYFQLSPLSLLQVSTSCSISFMLRLLQLQWYIGKQKALVDQWSGLISLPCPWPFSSPLEEYGSALCLEAVQLAVAARCYGSHPELPQADLPPTWVPPAGHGLPQADSIQDQSIVAIMRTIPLDLQILGTDVVRGYA